MRTQPWIIPARREKLRVLFCKGSIDPPEQLLGHVRVARLVRMRQAVAAWRSAVPYLGERPRVVVQAVADVVQAQGMGQRACIMATSWLSALKK